jgi:hypothetical protein
MNKLSAIEERDLRLCLADNIDRLRRLKTHPPERDGNENMGAYLIRMTELRYQILGMIWLTKDELKYRGIDSGLD